MKNTSVEEYNRLTIAQKIRYSVPISRIGIYLDSMLEHELEGGSFDYVWNVMVWTRFALIQTQSTDLGEGGCILWTGNFTARGLPLLRMSTPRSLELNLALMDKLLLDGGPPQFDTIAERHESTLSHRCNYGQFCTNGRHCVFESGTANKNRRICNNVHACINDCPHQPSCIPVVRGNRVNCHCHRPGACET